MRMGIYSYKNKIIYRFNPKYNLNNNSHREEWKFAISLNFNLCISCMIFMISYFFPLVNNPNRTFIYRIQVFLGSFGDISSLILTIVLTLMAKYYI